MDSLVHFLNHSLLPFIGRGAESERLMQFWRGAMTIHGLRAALLVGEAGIGKSRLIEEFIPMVIDSGGTVVRAKLRPGATASMLPLIAEGLWISNAGQQLLKSQPEPTLSSVAQAMQRLCRLRPTILIVEDIHLLQGDTFTEFTQLLESLSEEMLSLLCAARPVELSARGVLERYLVDELHLSGLSQEDLAVLCKDLFDLDPDPEMLAVLQQATLGNPLALRSALRGAIASGTIALDDARRQWHTTRFGSELASELKHNVRLLAEGMAAHLTREERDAAGQLACLGEVFARETAMRIIDQPERMLNELTFKGIILPTTTPTRALPGSESRDTPLAFTHSLVHKYFVEHARIDPDTLISVLHQQLPLYSVIPFELLGLHIGQIGTSPEMVRSACEYAISIARELEVTPDWMLGGTILDTVEALSGAYCDRWSPQDRRAMSVNILNRRYCSLEADPHGRERAEQVVTQMMELTAGPVTESDGINRLLSLGRQFHVSYPDLMHVWQANRLEVQEMIGHIPSLRASPQHIWYLTLSAQLGVLYYDSILSRSVESELRAITLDESLSQEVRNKARRRIGMYLVPVFDSRQELQERRTLLAELEEMTSGFDQELLTVSLFFRERVGDFDSFIQLCQRTIPTFEKYGITRNANNSRMQLLRTRIALGLDLDEAMNEAVRLCNANKGEFRLVLMRGIGQTFPMLAALRGDTAWGRRIAQAMEYDLEQLPNLELRVVLALEDGLGVEGLRQIALSSSMERRVNGQRLLALTRLLTSEGQVDPDAVLKMARDILGSPVLTISDAVMFRATVDLTNWAGSHLAGLEQIGDLLYNNARAQLRELLDWMDERKAWALIRPLISDYPSLLSPDELSTWQERLNISEDIRIEQKKQEEVPEKDRRIQISLLGSISVTKFGEEPQKLRGARQRTLLGVLAADAMTGHQLDHRDFCQIASGGEQDPEYARKYMNNAVHRVRDIVGRDAIRTDTKVPQLNFDLVGVDIIEASDRLRAAQEALRDHALSRATTEILAAFEITRGEVAFPSLYDEFFERLREQLENRSRGLLISISKAVLHERDAENAERLLQTGYALTPDDEELAELLSETLLLLGKNTEADQVRRKTQRALAD